MFLGEKFISHVFVFYVGEQDFSVIRDAGNGHLGYNG